MHKVTNQSWTVRRFLTLPALKSAPSSSSSSRTKQEELWKKNLRREKRQSKHKKTLAWFTSTKMLVVGRASGRINSRLQRLTCPTFALHRGTRSPQKSSQSLRSTCAVLTTLKSIRKPRTTVEKRAMIRSISRSRTPCTIQTIKGPKFLRLKKRSSLAGRPGIWILLSSTEFLSRSQAIHWNSSSRLSSTRSLSRMRREIDKSWFLSGRTRFPSRW